MIRSRLNTRLLVRTGIVLVVLAVCTHLLHAWQMRRHARGQLARADQAERAGQDKETITALAHYLVFRPDDPAVRSRYGMALARQASTDRARWQALRVLRSVLPRDGGPLDVRLQAADLALAVHEPDEACKLLQPAVAAHPDRADLHERLGLALEAAGRYHDAAESLETALARAPGRIDCAVRLASLYRTRLNLPRRGRTTLDRLVQRNPRLPRAYLARAEARGEDDDPAGAAADLTVARRLAPHDADILAASADLARKRGQQDAACVWGRQALAARPDSPALALALAQAERERGRPEAALAVVRSALRRRPGDTALAASLAELLIEQRSFPEAERLIRTLPRTGPGHSRRYLEGLLALQRGQPGEAIPSLRQASQAADPIEAGKALLALVRAFAALEARRDQLLAARQAFGFAVAPATRLELARVFVTAGQSHDVLAELRRLAGLPAPPPGVWNLLARALLEEGGSSRLRHWQEAERALARADAIPAEAATAALLRAELLLLRQEPDAAREILDTARARHPDDPPLWRASARLARLRGDEPAARAFLAEADRRFASRLDWLLERTTQLAAERGRQAVPELINLERRSTGLSERDRDRLSLHLLELYARLVYTAGVERLAPNLIARQPRNLRPRLLLLETRLAQGDEKGVTHLVDELRQLEGPTGLEWRCARASWLLRQGGRANREEARRLLLEAQRSHPTAPRPAFLLGWLADREGRPDQALPAYRRALDLGDTQPLTIRRTVTLLLAAGRLTEADQVLDHADRAAVLGPELWRPAAEVALRAGQTERACRLARRALTLTRRSHRDLLWLAGILQAAGRHTEAGEVLADAVRQAPEAADVWLAQLAHHVRQRQADAIPTCLAGMRQHLDASRLPLAEARAHEVLGQDDRAEQAYRRILADAPHDAEALSRLAALYLRTDQPARAEPILAALLGPRVLLPEEEQPEVRRRLALAITAPGSGRDRVDQALALVEMNRRQEGDSDKNRRVAALVRGARASDRSAALAALEALPGGPAVTAQERLRLAQLYESAGNWPRARRQYEALVNGDPDNATWLALFIEALLRAGKKSEAGERLAELEKRQPHAPRTARLREQLRRPR